MEIGSLVGAYLGYKLFCILLYDPKAESHKMHLRLRRRDA